MKQQSGYSGGSGAKWKHLGALADPQPTQSKAQFDASYAPVGFIFGLGVRLLGVGCRGLTTGVAAALCFGESAAGAG